MPPVSITVGAGAAAAAILSSAFELDGARSACASALAGVLETAAAGDIARTLFYYGGDAHSFRVGVSESPRAAAAHATRAYWVRGVIYSGAVSALCRGGCLFCV